MKRMFGKLSEGSSIGRQYRKLFTLSDWNAQKEKIHLTCLCTTAMFQDPSRGKETQVRKEAQARRNRD